MRLLIVEDDVLLADGLARSLRQSGHAVDWVDSAERAILAVEHEFFDLVILDIGLTGIDGFEMLKRLRRAERYVPVIVVTAHDAVSERVRGLDLGADDYLVKPFATEGLEARVRALIRRGHTPTSPQITLGPLTLDLVGRQARLADEPLELTVREWGIIELLATQPGVALSSERGAERLRSALAHEAGAEEGVSTFSTELFEQKFVEAMDDDFNTAQAVAVLFELTREINRKAEQGVSVVEAQHTLLKLAAVLGLTLKEKTELAPDADGFIGLLASVRDDLRQNRQWQLADKIRSGWADLGVILEDTPQGTRWKHKA